MNPFQIGASMRRGSETRSRRRLLGVGAVVLASTLALVGCSSGGTSSSDSSVKNLTLWISTSAEQQAGYDYLAKEYKKDFGITVKIVNIPNAGFATKLRDAAQANALPDVARVSGGIDPLWSNKTIDLASIVNDKSNYMNKDLIVTGSHGKVLCIPSDVTAAGLFINKSLFDKAGVTYPSDPAKTWTWDEFLAAATKVREATGAKYDLTFDASPSRLRAFAYELGSNYIHQGANGGTFSTNGKTTAALELFKSMNDDTIMPKSVWTSGADPNALFKSGQVVAYWSGVWQVADFASNITDFDWLSVPSPAQPVHATDINGGGEMVAFKNSDARGAAAKKFLAWTYEPKNYTKLSSINGFLPVEKDLDITYPFTSKAALDSFSLYNKEISAAAPISNYFSKAQITWALKGQRLTTDPTLVEVGKLINDQQNVKMTIKNIIGGYDQQVLGK